MYRVWSCPRIPKHSNPEGDLIPRLWIFTSRCACKLGPIQLIVDDYELINQINFISADVLARALSFLGNIGDKFLEDVGDCLYLIAVNKTYVC